MDTFYGSSHISTIADLCFMQVSSTRKRAKIFKLHSFFVQRQHRLLTCSCMHWRRHVKTRQAKEASMVRAVEAHSTNSARRSWKLWSSFVSEHRRARALSQQALALRKAYQLAQPWKHWQQVWSSLGFPKLLRLLCFWGYLVRTKMSALVCISLAIVFAASQLLKYLLCAQMMCDILQCLQSRLNCASRFRQ